MLRKKRKITTNLCGMRIKLSRVEKGMNQLQLAIALSEDFGLRMDQNSIGNIEAGDRFVKDFELVALAEVLDKNPLWLLFGDKIPSKYQKV